MRRGARASCEGSKIGNRIEPAMEVQGAALPRIHVRWHWVVEPSPLTPGPYFFATGFAPRLLSGMSFHQFERQTGQPPARAGWPG